MTDNRTTEPTATERIIATLRERGVQFATYGNTDRVWWTTENGVAWYAQDRPNANDLYVKLEAVLTPDQAIAATLGKPKAKSHPYGYERDTGAYDCTRCECGCINDISATYCNDCGGEIEIDGSAEKEYYDGYSKHTVFAKKHDDGSLEFRERRYVPEDAATLGSGTLTAEQVRECVQSVYMEGYSDGSVNRGAHIDETDWQAIADELNSRTERTCRNVEDSKVFWFICSECGHLQQLATMLNYCQKCGAKVVGE